MDLKDFKSSKSLGSGSDLLHVGRGIEMTGAFIIDTHPLHCFQDHFSHRNGPAPIQPLGCFDIFPLFPDPFGAIGYDIDNPKTGPNCPRIINLWGDGMPNDICAPLVHHLDFGHGFKARIFRSNSTAPARQSMHPLSRVSRAA